MTSLDDHDHDHPLDNNTLQQENTHSNVLFRSSLSTSTSTSTMKQSTPQTLAKPLLHPQQYTPSPFLSTSAYTSNNNSPPPSILRVGETLDSLFGQSTNDDDDDDCVEYRSLCQQLLDDSSNVVLWMQVLQLAKQQSFDSEQQKVRHLLRLHRRATSRFTLTPETLSLWLSYASVQPYQDALLTLRHVARIGSHQAEYYLTKSIVHEQQQDYAQAIATLQQGIQQTAEPLQVLVEKLEELQKQQHPALSSSSSSSSSCGNKNQQGDEGGGNEHQVVADNDENDDDDDDITMPQDNKRVHLATTTTAHTSSTSLTATVSDKNGARSNKKSRSTTSSTTDESPFTRRPTFQIGSSIPPIAPSILSTTKRPPLVGSKLLQRTGNDILMNPQRLDTNLLEEPGAVVERERDVTMATHNQTDHNHHTNTTTTLQHPPSSTTKKMDLSYMLTWDPEKHRQPKLHSKQQQQATTVSDPSPIIPTPSTIQPQSPTCETKKPTITRMELAYMLEWDPSKTKGSQSLSSEHSKEKEHTLPSLTSSVHSDSSLSSSKQQHTKPITMAVDTDAKDDDDTKQQHTSAAAAATGTMHTGEGLPGSNRTKRQSMVAAPKTIEKSSSSRRRSRSSAVVADQQETTTSDLVARLNKDFLRLACEENMLTVNGVAYAKLGVIGKGGSCKVYQALSKEGQVLAIKKVKTAGLDKKAMLGYANEIALLKRLRGNPAIIQLFDSQVDPVNKAIFLVMEPGEVDLNHVLQQQAALAATATDANTRNAQNHHHYQPKLNMNFIRLIWQQMLSAVHCIHEERIVHGDLKPANFLFVRGALKLIDFGIAKAIQSDDTTNIYRDSQIGTVNYMSPESLINETGDKQWKMGRASDIWSLGCILYQMIYGKTPFAELHLIQKIQAIINPNHQISFPATVEDAAIDCMKQCLRRQAEERPPIVGTNGLLNEHAFLNSHR